MCKQITDAKHPHLCIHTTASCLRNGTNTGHVKIISHHRTSTVSVTTSLESAPFISSSTSFWHQFLHFLHTYSYTRHFFLFWFTTLFIHISSFTPSLNYMFHKSYPRSFTSSSQTAITDYCPYHIIWPTRFLFLVFLVFCFCAMR